MDVNGQEERPPAASSDDATIGTLGLKTGSIVDKRFEILDYRGKGASAEVYRARNLLTGDILALKVMVQKLDDDPNKLERFFREAKVASSLSHPGTVAIKAFGKTADGLVFMVMEYIEGQTLAELIALHTRLKLQELAAPLSLVADALANAHENGVVHRDIKPSNIMILNFRTPEYSAKILDFGLARLLEGSADQSLTKTGTILGTPAYLSPELCRGESATPASDIYSFGAVIYEALTGKQPFSGGSSLEQMSKHLSENLCFPDSPKLNGKIQAIISRCMKKLPADRYANASQVGRELVQAAEQSISAESSPFKIRAQIGVIVCAFLAAVSIIFGVKTSRSVLEDKHERSTQSKLITENVSIDSLLDKANRFHNHTEWKKEKAYLDRALELANEKFITSASTSSRNKDQLLRNLMLIHKRIATIYDCPDLQMRLGHARKAVEMADKLQNADYDDERADAYFSAFDQETDPEIRLALLRKTLKARASSGQSSAIQLGLQLLPAQDPRYAIACESMARSKSIDHLPDTTKIGLQGLTTGLALRQGAKALGYLEEKKRLLALYRGHRENEENAFAEVCGQISHEAEIIDNKTAQEWMERGLHFNKLIPDQGAQATVWQRFNMLSYLTEQMQNHNDWDGMIRVQQEMLDLAEHYSGDYSGTIVGLDGSIKGTIYCYLGAAYLGKKNYKQAVESLENSLSLSPKATPKFRIKALQLLWETQCQMGNLRAARVSAKRIISLAEQDPENLGSYISAAKEFLKQSQSAK